MSHNPSYHQVVQEYVALEIKLDFSMPNQGLNKLYYKNIIINLNRKSRVIHSQQKKIDKAKTFWNICELTHNQDKTVWLVHQVEDLLWTHGPWNFKCFQNVRSSYLWMESNVQLGRQHIYRTVTNPRHVSRTRQTVQQWRIQIRNGPPQNTDRWSKQ